MAAKISPLWTVGLLGTVGYIGYKLYRARQLAARSPAEVLRSLPKEDKNCMVTQEWQGQSHASGPFTYSSARSVYDLESKTPKGTVTRLVCGGKIFAQRVAQ